jgi:hypothetical protein
MREGKYRIMRSTKLAVWGSLALSIWGFAGPAPGAGRYLKVDYPASTAADRLQTPVAYTLWIPDGVSRLRCIIVHQHGAGTTASIEGSTAAYDLHWQALATKWDCALFCSSYHVANEKTDLTPGGSELWFDPRRGSEKTFLKALGEFAAQSGHAEIETVPWVLWGHSGGGIWADVMSTLHPERVIAIWMRSGSALMFRSRSEFPQPEVPAGVYAIPSMCNPGVKEKPNVPWSGTLATFQAYRAEGAPIGFAPDPRTGHECGDSRYLAIPFLDACLAMRLPDKGSQDQTLKPVDDSRAWLGSWEEQTAVPAASYQGDPKKAVWLPNEAVAKAWLEYVKTGAVSDTTPPPVPYDVKATDQGEQGTLVEWSADADFESGVRCFLVLRDGQELAQVPQTPMGKFGRPLFESMTYHDTPSQPLPKMQYMDASTQPGEKHTYAIVTVNSVGLKSEPSAPAATTASARLLPWIKAPVTLRLYRHRDTSHLNYMAADGHGGGTKTDMRKYECSASYAVPERDFQEWDSAPCYNEIFTTAQFVRNRGDNQDMWKQLVWHWMPAARLNAQELYHAPGMCIVHGYLPPVKPDKYVHTTITLEFCLGTMGQLIRPIWDEWDYGGDVKFLRAQCYPVMKEAATFFAGYAKKGEDNYYHLIPSMEPERWGFYPGFLHDKDEVSSLCMARWTLTRAADAADFLKVDAEQSKQWREVAAHLMPYATWKTPAGMIYAASPGVEPQHMGGDHPFEAVSYIALLADDINIDSPQEQKDMMIRTMRTPSTAKTGETMFVLGVPYTSAVGGRGGGGGGRPVARDGEALLNSRSGRIHLFPVVDKAAVVAFHNFQARGGFLVSAAKNADGVYFLEIEPRRDNTCRLMNPWPSQAVVVRDAGRAQPVPVQIDRGNGECLTFATTAGHRYLVERQ